MDERLDANSWDAVIAAGVAAQRLVPGCVAVGGSAAALYAHHRVSMDTDHLLVDLRSRFDEVRDALERDPAWKTARVQAPVVILGSIAGVQVGFRQARHRGEIEARVLTTPAGSLVVPTLDEMIGMKAYMAYARNATRDYLDLAALADLAGDDATVAALLKSDDRYGHLQQSSVALLIAQRLASAAPYDLEDVDLSNYKGLVPAWQNWERVASICRRIGGLLLKRLLDGV